jgi:hypothetical protein
MKIKKAKESVVTVGEGRGFVVNGPGDVRLIVTAAHGLPFLPPPDVAAYIDERTYQNLLGPLGSEPNVWAECLFVDPVADLAILGSPDDQALWEQADAYRTLVKSTMPLSIADAPKQGHGWMLSLDGEWFRCTLQFINDGPVWISKTAQPIDGGMSGSPIVLDDGTAIGVVCSADVSANPVGSINPRLVRSLPGWFLRFRAVLD